ncbi:MAG TPA: hypothetical protein VGW39_14675 [Chthoniobacterales bacterium]|nr:hypothetical protein [Chthoniobacterales bacterium]
MVKKFMSLLAATAFIGGGAMLFAQGGAKSGEGTLMLQDKNYTLSHGLAYETETNGEDVIAVVLTGQAISAEDLKTSRESERKGGFADFKRPFLILNFAKTGELKWWSAASSNTSIGSRSAGGKAAGELKLQDGRVSGKASQPRDAEGMFPTAFDVRFDVKLLAAGESLPATVVKKPGPAANVKPMVTGLFKGNGKEAKIAYVSAQWQEPFGDKPSIKLVFTEKDHSKVKKPDFDAAFGKLGSALIISLHDDGGIFGCQVVHSAHSKQGFSSIGSIRTNNFKYEDGKVEGELTTDKQVDTFGETWEVNLKFVAPLGETPKEFQVPDSKQPEETASSKSKKPTNEDGDDEDEDDDDEKPASQPAKDQLNVKDLAVTKDASDFEYKTMVEHVLFKSKASTKAVVAELTANLKAQGWATDGRDLVTPASSILKRKRGEASLTIFVKPDEGGSKVQIFTEGLSWTEK